MCKAKGYYKRRECFLESDSITVVIPTIEEGGRVNQEGDAEDVGSPKRMLEILAELQGKISAGLPVFQILFTYFKTVCPVSLTDPSYFELIKMESHARDYHVLPYPGGTLDQPNLVMEAFDVISTARNWYERDRMKKVTEEMKRKQQGVK